MKLKLFIVKISVQPSYLLEVLAEESGGFWRFSEMRVQKKPNQKVRNNKIYFPNKPRRPIILLDLTLSK
jgi:hypothetical protein